MITSQTFAEWATIHTTSGYELGDGFVMVPITIEPTINDYYMAIAAGAVLPTSVNDLISPADGALSAVEWSWFSPEVKSWAAKNPQAFMQSLLSHRNPANNDLASIGAEGGYGDPGKIAVGVAGLDYTNAGYLAIHDENGLGGIMALIAVAAAIYTGGSALGWFGSGAAGTTGSVAGSIAYGTCDITVAEMTALGYTPAVASTAIDTLVAIESTGGTIPTIEQLTEIGYSQSAAETVVAQLEVSAANGAALAASGDAAIAAGEAVISASADAAIAIGDVTINAATPAAIASLSATAIPITISNLQTVVNGLKTIGMTPTQAVTTALKLFTSVTTGGKPGYVKNPNTPATYGDAASQYGISPNLTPMIQSLMLPAAILLAALTLR